MMKLSSRVGNGAEVGVGIENVTVAYHGTVALRDVSLHLQPGTICGLVGMNGSGKSTLFKAIMGFVTVQNGRVRVGGLRSRMVQKRGLVAYVPQAEEVDWEFPISVRDVVMMGRYGNMSLLRLPSRDDRRAVDEALERVSMTNLANRQIGELSGGQKKRAFVARALAQEAAVLLLDEPFAGVDVTTQALIIEVLSELRSNGRTILVSTHDLPSVNEFCDEVVLLNTTKIAHGSAAEVMTEDNLAKTFGRQMIHLPDSQDKVMI